MIINPESIEELKEIFVRILLSRTDDVTKVSDGSVLNGVSYAAAKLAQKALKDIALAQANIYPDSAYGSSLDNIANEFGIAARFGSLGSSTYVRLVGTPGTVYTSGTQVFSGQNGVLFDLLETKTVGADGFTYAKIASQTVGANTNVDSLTINKVSPIPLGHVYVINEYNAVGGRDIEDDTAFRDRIKNSINTFARGTLAYLTQVFNKINPNVLRVFDYGSDGNGKIVLGIATQNGIDLSPSDLTDISAKASQYLSLSDLNPDGLGGIGVMLVNITWQPEDISMRLELFNGFNIDEVRKEMQIRLQKLLDYRTWVAGTKVDWGLLLTTVRETQGIKTLDDNYFLLNGLRQDSSTDLGKLPRIRGFIIMDLNGNVISNGSGSLIPTFYPVNADFSFFATVLSTL